MSEPNAHSPLSVAIITLNEESRLLECLKSVSFANDIVVVDSGSTDNTISIAESFGARVFRETWKGFGHQKQLAIDRCINKWVLVLDADERIPIETKSEIVSLVTASVKCIAYKIPRKNYFLHRWIRHAGWWPDHVIRLINKDFCRMNNKPVHESVEVNGQIGILKHPIVHYATKSIEHTMDKMNRYSSLGAEEMLAKGEKSSFSKSLSRGAWAFTYNYFFRLGFCDGAPGFIIAVSDALNKFFKYAKLVDLQKNNSIINGNINCNSKLEH